MNVIFEYAIVVGILILVIRYSLAIKNHENFRE
jgi:hypothetical protein